MSSRMSPAGIPLFYGALDEATAIKEMLERKNETDKYAIIAKFEAVNDLEILNFCNIPELPSLFDLEKNQIRQTIEFLKQFASEISKVILLDGREHIDYVPTQVLTEYFRYIYRYKRKRSYDGILYPSAQVTPGINCALFINNELHIANTDKSKIAFNLNLIDQTQFKI